MSDQSDNTNRHDQDEHEPYDLSPETRNAERRDAHVSAGADEMPTLEEEAAAEAAAEHVDVESVARHEREMMDIGANVKGEGQIPS